MSVDVDLKQAGSKARKAIASLRLSKSLDPDDDSDDSVEAEDNTEKDLEDGIIKDNEDLGHVAIQNEKEDLGHGIRDAPKEEEGEVLPEEDPGHPAAEEDLEHVKQLVQDDTKEVEDLEQPADKIIKAPEDSSIPLKSCKILLLDEQTVSDQHQHQQHQLHTKTGGKVQSVMAGLFEAGALDHILELIFMHLDGNSLASAASTCKRWNSFLKMNLWKRPSIQKRLHQYWSCHLPTFSIKVSASVRGYSSD